ncbi:NAD(P)-binding protein [Comamonas composti]|uniref:NAD(P)-binding protein n=1 Tax=Comamonas composti TaxID=408558 RepID=UPI0003F59AD0|nr:NAD(P)-binding protein [Comamonas composti]
MSVPSSPGRRRWLQSASAGAAARALMGMPGLAAHAGCTQPSPRIEDLPGGFTGQAVERGHALKPWWQRLAQGLDLPPPAVVHRAPVLIAGGGMAGLAAARALELAGVQGAVLLDLQESMGGNSRAGEVQGVACPLGAHYLPLPGDDASEVQDWLEQLGLRERRAGRWQYDERHLCHSPQERLFWQGGWHEGLLPVDGVQPQTLEQYRRFAACIAGEMRRATFAIPSIRVWQRHAGLPASHAGLDAQTMAGWLGAQGLDDAQLLWYLDYCCRDDFGAGLNRVSAWAGVHYFASRHGFATPQPLEEGREAEEAGSAVLTWPQGNGWLVQQLLAGLVATGLQTDCSVLAIAEAADGVQIDTYHHGRARHERWLAARCVVALPSFVAARVVRDAPQFLRSVAGRLDWAPWLVANVHLQKPLMDWPGAPPAWDNVLFDDPNTGGLGYVDAGHQNLDRLTPRPTVLSYYQALGDWPDGRRQLLAQPFAFWRERIVPSLLRPHPDLLHQATRMEITRYGHAMAIPRPGDQQHLSAVALQALHGKGRALCQGEPVSLLPTPGTRRLWFAHSDWAGYSVLEEAFVRGHHAGLWAGRRD